MDGYTTISKLLTKKAKNISYYSFFIHAASQFDKTMGKGTEQYCFQKTIEALIETLMSFEWIQHVLNNLDNV